MAVAQTTVPTVLTSQWPAAGLSPLHRLPPQTKLVALIGFACCVVATPPMLAWPYAAQLVVVMVAAGVARLHPGRLLRGLAIELPFVAFALAMPFFAVGERVTVAGVSVSVAGLWGAFALLAKSTLAVLAALILAATTTRAEFVAGMQRLHLPAVLVEILSFMVRYLDVITEQWRRMAVARAARGFRPRNPAAWPVLSGAIGAGFVRAFERGERVHLAMLARGYAGAMPDGVNTARPARGTQWAAVVGFVLIAAAITAVAWGLR